MNVSSAIKLGTYKHTPRYKRLNGTIENTYTLFASNANLVIKRRESIIFR